MMTEDQYPYDYPAAKPVSGNDSETAWMAEGPKGSGLLWVVSLSPEPEVYDDGEDDGRVHYRPSGDEYVVADFVTVMSGVLMFALGHPTESHAIWTKSFAPGTWRTYHLLADPHLMAAQTVQFANRGSSNG